MTPVDLKLQTWKDAISLNVHPKERGMFETLKIGLLCAKPNVLVQALYAAQNKGHLDEARQLYSRIQELRFNELQNSNTEITGGYSASWERAIAKQQGFDYLSIGARAKAPEPSIVGLGNELLSGTQTSADQPHSSERLWPEVILEKASQNS